MGKFNFSHVTRQPPRKHKFPRVAVLKQKHPSQSVCLANFPWQSTRKRDRNLGGKKQKLDESVNREMRATQIVVNSTDKAKGE